MKNQIMTQSHIFINTEGKVCTYKPIYWHNKVDNSLSWVMGYMELENED